VPGFSQLRTCEATRLPRYSTSHQRYREWTPTRLLEWAEAIGQFTRRLVETMLIDKPYPEAGYRAAMGLRSIARQYGDQRLEAAATRAVRAKLFRLDSIRSILQHTTRSTTAADAGSGSRAGRPRQYPRRYLLQRRHGKG
jgi:hypothetical protein